MPSGSVSPAEIARFDALAAHWWDEGGPMRSLHRMNPVRVRWIAERIVQADASPTRSAARKAESRAQILDIGCGAGVAAEALARRGFDVLGLDAAGRAIDAARAHAAGKGLPLTYRTGVAEDLRAEDARFLAIVALEVIEHVADPGAFLATLAALLAPRGRLFISTLNRTPQSFLAAKIGAEYLLRWLPVGTHNWRSFVTPAELGGLLRQVGLRVIDIAGLRVHPLTGQWSTDRNVSINYIIAAGN
jgi:2-polyprenyl-6-hydroxyphenyl methylase/3-demethylubiquinone-9 3-methyltransferase